ncbi:hypothetical protein KQQSB11_380302 [Klebsiella quasipneumoniae subsp. quasipneumoniae]|nr:hypothetical protein KQQSB11_380302 [Klebsiella quasipneumoniae subsp. quasipneumoniae]
MRIALFFPFSPVLYIQQSNLKL